MWTELSVRAIDEARTRDLHLGKVAYYQLYYYRILPAAQRFSRGGQVIIYSRGPEVSTKNFHMLGPSRAGQMGRSELEYCLSDRYAITSMMITKTRKTRAI